MNNLKAAATSVQELEVAIGEAIKVLYENTGLIVSDIDSLTKGYIHDGSKKVYAVKLQVRT